MSNQASLGQTRPDLPDPIRGKVLRRLAQVVVIFLVQAALLFASSGRLDWAMAWAYLATYAGFVALNALVIVPRMPELVAERGQPGENVKGWDKALALLVSIVGPFATLITAGLDLRSGWSAPMALVVQVVGLGIYALGMGLWSWAMASNRFFSGLVRIQTDRGHTVATGGPYRHVRHPGYLALIAFTLATPVLLGSAWALAPAALDSCLVVVRTALEDRTLRDELPGYDEYARRVRYRLLPGVW